MAGKDERALEVGLFRYALIREAADLSLSKAERGRLVRALAAREHVGPDGRLVVVGRSTLDDWIRAYRAGGFEALCPRPRQSGPLTAARVLCLAEALKRELPDRTAAQVRQVMLASGEQVPALRTLQRHFARLGLNVRADGRTPVKVYGRFEASERNELWTGDGLHGPKVAGRTAILLAFIDDYSRMLVGYRWGTAEDVLRLEAALRSGLCARGVPDGILVDRGSAFVSHQLLRACAVLGVKLIHASPRAATTKRTARGAEQQGEADLTSRVRISLRRRSDRDDLPHLLRHPDHSPAPMIHPQIDRRSRKSRGLSGLWRDRPGSGGSGKASHVLLDPMRGSAPAAEMAQGPPEGAGRWDRASIARRSAR